MRLAGVDLVWPLAPGVVLGSTPGGPVVVKQVPPGWRPLPVDHPHLLAPLAVVDGAAVLPFCAGGSLAALVARRGRLAPGEVVAVAGSLAGAVAAVHAAGRLHLDVTPGNVLFTADGEPLLADPGRPGRGTPGFVAPEVAAGGRPGPAADVYGLAATCRFALGGDTAAAPPVLAAVLAAGLAADPGRRPPAAAVASALAKLPGRWPVPPATAEPVPGPATVELPVRPPAPAAPLPARSPSRRRPVAAAAAVVALVAGGSAVAWAADRSAAPAGVAGCPPAPAAPPVAAGGTLVRAPVGPGGCPGAVAWDPATGIATVASPPTTARYRLGRPGDVLLVGDWDGDGRATPALYRPATGEVLAFDAWPGGAGAVPSRPPVAARPGGWPRVVAGAGGDRVEVDAPGERA